MQPLELGGGALDNRLDSALAVAVCDGGLSPAGRPSRHGVGPGIIRSGLFLHGLVARKVGCAAGADHPA